jgi:PadR family transcriptional regulator, regulatory protein AphA
MSTTPYAILGLLSIEPMAGYDIRRELEENLSYFWSESYGQIYPALKRLEAARLITPVKRTRPDARRRRQYTVTPLGEARLRAWLAEPPRPQPPRNELLLKIFFGRLAPRGACAAHLRRLRVQQEHLMTALRHIERQLLTERRGEPNLRYRLIAINAGLSRAEGLIKWSEHALMSLGGAR